MANQIKYKVGFDVDTTSLKQLKSSLQELQKISAGDLLEKNASQSVTQVSSNLLKIKQEAKTVEQALKEAYSPKLNTVNIQTFNEVLARSKTNLNQVYQTFQLAGAKGEAAFRNLTSQILNVNTQLKGSHVILDKMATTLTNTLKWNVASSAINGMTRSVQQAWGYVKSLDSSLNDIRIVTGKSSDQMARFAEQANNAAKQLGKTTTDYTKASLIYAQQGLSDEEIEARARITLKAANVTGQSTDAVSEELTAVWNGYKVTADEAELYVDRLAAIAAHTASNLEELSTGMSKVASAAAAMGVGEEQLAAQLSTIISVTRQAPESVGTALRTVYARISDIKAGIDEDGVTLGNYSGKMQALGFSVLDATGNLRDMGEVMEEIGNHWQDLTREQQVNLAQTMAGQRQYSNLIALFDNFDQYNRALNIAQNSTGTLQQQQDIYMESTAAHLNELRASMQDVYDSIIDREALDSINDLIDALSEAASFGATFIDSIGGGKSLLTSLGAIGVTVFSDQIARGIMTSIHNFDLMKQRAFEVQQAIQAIDTIQATNNLDPTTSAMLDQRKQLLQSKEILGSERFGQIQTLLNEVIQAQNQVDILKDKLNSIYKIAGITNISQLFEGDNFDNFIQKIQNLEKEFNELRGTSSLYRQELDYIKQIDLKNNHLKSAKNDFKELTQTAQQYIEQLLQVAQEGGYKRHIELIESWKKKILELNDQLSKTDDNIDAQAIAKKLEQAFRRLEVIRNQLNATNKNIINQSQNPQELAKNIEGTQNKIDNQQVDVDRKNANLNAALKDAIKAEQIKNITNVVGGIGQIGAAIQQVQNLGSIWKNADLNTGQKLLQTITNLSMSIPMLISGFTRINKTVQLFGTTQDIVAIKTGKSVTALGAQVIGLKAVELAGNKAGIAMTFFGRTLILTGAGAFILALTAIAAALAIVISKQQELRKQRIETAQSQIEQQNRTQEAIQKNNELYDSIEKVNNKYKQGQITRAELKTSIQDLIDQYGIENSQVQNLTQNYDNLTEAIKRARKEAAKEKFESVKLEKQSFEDILTEKSFGLTIDIRGLDDQKLKKFQELFPEAQKYIAEYDAEGNAVVTEYLLQVPKTLDAITDFQERLSEFKAEFNNDENRNEIQAYNDTSDGLKRVGEYAGDAASLLAEYHDAAKDVIDLDFNFSEIPNLSQYRRIRQQITKAYQDAGLENAQDLADAYLAKNYQNLFSKFDNPLETFSKFDDATKKLDIFEEKLGEIPDELQEINNIINNLDEQGLDNFLELNPDIFNDYEQLLKVLSELDKYKKSTSYNVDNYQATQKENLDNYKKYTDLQETVSQGKEIKEEDFIDLDEEIQKLFDYAGGGMYKLTADTKEFNELVNKLSLEGWKNSIAAANEQLERNKNILEGKNKGQYTEQDISGNSIKTVKVDQNLAPQTIIDTQLAERQLKYLQRVYEIGTQQRSIVDSLKQQLEQKEFGLKAAQQLNELLDITGNKLNGINDRNSQIKQQLNEMSEQLQEAMFPLDEDVDEDVFNNLAQIYEEQADQIEGINDAMKGNKEWAEDTAQAVLRFDDAIKDVIDSYEDWLKILNGGNLAEYAGIVDELTDAYADLLNFKGQNPFSDEFLRSTDNLNLMKAAIDGDVDAYNQLMEIAQQDIITNITINDDSFWTNKAAIEESLASLEASGMSDIEIDAYLNSDGFIDALNSMIAATNATIPQINNLIDTMGISAEVYEEPAKTKTQSTSNQYWVPATYTTKSIATGGQQMVGNYQALTIDKPGYWVTRPGTTTTVIPGTGSIKVKNAHKTAGGDIKYAQAPRGGGTSRPSTGGGSGGGGGGGGGGGSKPDTSKKDKKKSVKTQKDPYHDINIQLQKINRQLERVQDKQERLYGKQLIDNLNKQNQLLEQQKKKLLEKSKIQKKDLEDQRKALKQMGATFDKQGNLTNYSDLISQRQAEIQAMYNQYNKSIQKYNNSTDADYKKALSQSLSQYDKQIKEKEDSLKELTSAISKYDKTREQFEDNLDEIEEATQKQIEINIKKFNMQLEIRLDMSKAERDWNKFKRNVLEKTDVLKSSNFDKIFGDAKQSFEDLFSYFNVHGSIGSIETLTNQLNATKQQIEQIDKTGTSAIYGDNKAQAMEDLQKNLDELMDQMQDIEELIDNIDQAYLDTIDDIQEGFDEQIESYEYVQDLLKSDLDLLQLLYGDKNYDAMNSYYEQLQKNNNKQLDSLKHQREFWKEQWNEAVAKGDTNAAKKFEQNYKNTISNLNQLIQDSVENLQNKYSNAVEQIFDALDKKLTSGKGSDYLQESWDLMTKNADQYLDAVNSAFAIQSTQRKYQNALNETKSIKNQQALKDLMDQQLKILKNKDKLTQYDVDRAQKLLEVEQARIALEDARSAKTSMRLKRDSQGNYSYEYMADEEGINEAEQNYANAQNDLYNFDLNKTNQTTSEILATWNEFKDKYKEIMLDVSLSDEAQHEKLKLLQDQYSEYFNLKTEQLIGARENLMESAFQNFASLYGLDVQNYKDMADAEKEILMSDMVPTWNNGIVAMATKMAGEGGLLPVCKEAFLDLDSTTQNYKKDLDELASAADIDFDDIKNGIDNDVLAFSELIQANDELIQKMSNQLQSIKLLKTAADELKQKYKETTDAAKEAVSQIHDFIQAQQAQAADYIANQHEMANAYAAARAKEADAYIAAVNRIVAAINNANNGNSSGGSNPGGANPSDKNNNSGKKHYTTTYEANSQAFNHFATGGYTGDWNSDEGRIAVLHEKELVLNKEDTKNILDAVQIIRALNDSVLGKAYDINSGLSLGKNSQDNQQTLEQNVHITASFPNVDSKKQIKEAFSELTNLAAQRAMRR